MTEVRLDYTDDYTDDSKEGPYSSVTFIGATVSEVLAMKAEYLYLQTVGASGEQKPSGEEPERGAPMPNPTPEPCGCQVVITNHYDPPDYGSRIIYCPTHAAAPALLAALEEIANYRSRPNDLYELGRLREVARAAIAQAKEETPAAANRSWGGIGR